MVHIPRADDPREPSLQVATDDAARLREMLGPLLERAADVQWYEHNGTDVDGAALALCRLRRTMAGQYGAPQRGDDAVRQILEQASPEAVVWIASRAVSYMDENGFPEAVSPWFSEGTD